MSQKMAGKKVLKATKKAINLAGGQAEVARKMNISRAAVHQWASRGVPATRVRSLAALVDHKVSPAQIRPDIFGD